MLLSNDRVSLFPLKMSLLLSVRCESIVCFMGSGRRIKRWDRDSNQRFSFVRYRFPSIDGNSRNRYDDMTFSGGCIWIERKITGRFQDMEK